MKRLLLPLLAALALPTAVNAETINKDNIINLECSFDYDRLNNNKEWDYRGDWTYDYRITINTKTEEATTEAKWLEGVKGGGPKDLENVVITSTFIKLDHATPDSWGELSFTINRINGEIFFKNVLFTNNTLWMRGTCISLDTLENHF